METKVCCRCKEEKPATAEYFFRNHSKFDGFRHECKECSKTYVTNNKEKIIKQRKEFRERNRDRLLEKAKEKFQRPTTKARTRVYNILKSYSISEKELRDLMDSQKGCCAICKNSLVDKDSKRSYMVDHNHTTGKVRGLLCISCNAAIGHLKESKEVLLSAIEYLETHNE